MLISHEKEEECYKLWPAIKTDPTKPVIATLTEAYAVYGSGPRFLC